MLTSQAHPSVSSGSCGLKIYNTYAAYTCHVVYSDTAFDGGIGSAHATFFRCAPTGLQDSTSSGPVLQVPVDLTVELDPTFASFSILGVVAKSELIKIEDFDRIEEIYVLA